MLGNHEESQGDPEYRLNPLRQETVHDPEQQSYHHHHDHHHHHHHHNEPARYGKREGGGEESEKPAAGVQVRVDRLHNVIAIVITIVVFIVIFIIIIIVITILLKALLGTESERRGRECAPVPGCPAATKTMMVMIVWKRMMMTT